VLTATPGKGGCCGPLTAAFSPLLPHFAPVSLIKSSSTSQTCASPNASLCSSMSPHAVAPTYPGGLHILPPHSGRPGNADGDCMLPFSAFSCHPAASMPQGPVYVYLVRFVTLCTYCPTTLLVQPAQHRAPLWQRNSLPNLRLTARLHTHATSIQLTLPRGAPAWPFSQASPHQLRVYTARTAACSLPPSTRYHYLQSLASCSGSPTARSLLCVTRMTPHKCPARPACLKWPAGFTPPPGMGFLPPGPAPTPPPPPPAPP
jgi:hypothetical protein